MAGRKIQYIQQETPSFIKNFKAKVGYKEPDTVDRKFEKLEKSSNEEEDREGEKPVVILGTNVTEQEARDFLEKKREGEEKSEKQDHEAEADEKEKHHGDKQEKGKIVFKKPTKRKSGESGKDDRKRQKEKHKSSSSSKAVKNSSLLSFGDEEEEED